MSSLIRTVQAIIEKNAKDFKTYYVNILYLQPPPIHDSVALFTHLLLEQFAEVVPREASPILC